MRLLFATSMDSSLRAFRLSGQSKRIEIYLAELARACGEVAYLSYARAERAEDMDLPDDCRGRVIVLDNCLGLRKELYAFLAPVVWARYFKTADVFLVGQAIGVIPALVARLLYGTPYVVLFGYYYVDAKRVDGRYVKAFATALLLRFAARFSAGALARTPELRQQAQRWTSGRPVALVRNGVNTEPFRECTAGTGAAKRVVCVGRLEPAKNLHVVIEAVSRLSDRHDILLVMAGDGTDLDRLRATAASLAVRTEFRGVVPNGELPTVLDGASAFVNASQTEGANKALVEAMAAGLPCIASDCPGNVSTIEDGVTGIVFPRGSVDALCRALDRVLSDTELAVCLGRRARQVATDEYDITVIVREEAAVALSAARSGARDPRGRSRTQS